MTKQKFIDIQSSLILIIPFLLLTGPFLPDLTLTIVSISTTTYIIIKKNFKYFKTNFFLFFAIFYFYIVFNSIFINPYFDSLRISITYIRFGLFVISFWYLLDNNLKLIKNLFFSILICFILLLFDGYFQFLFKYNLFGFPIDPSGRISSFFGDELILGSYLSRFFPILFGLTIFLFSKEKKIIILISFLFILAETLIFLSGERSSFFYVNFSAIFIILFIQNFKIYRLATLIASIILISFVSIYSPLYKNRIVDDTLNQMGLSNKDENSEKYIFSKQHTEHYISAIKIFEKNMIFGAGIKSFKSLCSKKDFKISDVSCSTHPHNTYIQLLAELGLIGFLLVIYSLLYICYYSFKNFFFIKRYNTDQNNLQVCIVSAILISLWPFIPTGNFFNNWLNIIYFFPIGIFFWNLKNLNKS